MSNETTTETVDELSDFEKEFMQEAEGQDVALDESSEGVQEIEQEQETVEPVVSQDTEADEVVDANPVSELEDLKKERDHYKHGFDANKGRVSALQKKINDLESQLSNPPQPEVKEEIANPSNSGMSDEKWQEFKEEYPEMAEAFEAKLDSLSNNFNARIESDVSSRLSTIQKELEPLKQEAHDDYVKGQLAVLTEKHPDWQAVASSDNFNKWIVEQSEKVQDLMNSLDARDAASVFDLYKTHSNHAQKMQEQKISDNRQSRLQSNVGVKAKSSKTGAGIPSEFDDAFDYFASQSK